MKYFFLFIISIIITSEVFSQGKIDGFYIGKNNGNVVLGFGFEDTKEYLAGENKTGLSRSLYYVNLFAAYGITDNLDLNVNLPYLSSNAESNLQDISVMLKYRAFTLQTEEGSLQFSLAAGFSTPLSDYNLGGLNDIGQQATIIETRAMVHYHWISGWFTTLQSGYSFKLEETPNSLPITFKAGRASSKWYYDVFYDYQKSFGGIDYRGTPSPQNFKEIGVDYHKVGGTLYKPFSEKVGAYISLSYILSGRNTFVGPAYGTGVVYNFGK